MEEVAGTDVSLLGAEDVPDPLAEASMLQCVFFGPDS